MNKYCLYYKTDKKPGEDYVVRSGNHYHVDGYELIVSDSFGIKAGDYTDTDYED